MVVWQIVRVFAIKLEGESSILGRTNFLVEKYVFECFCEQISHGTVHLKKVFSLNKY